MLPEDAKQHKLLAFDKARLSLVTDHFSPEDARPIPYSDSTFRAAAIESLIETNQVRQFLQNITSHFILTVTSHCSHFKHLAVQRSRIWLTSCYDPGSDFSARLLTGYDYGTPKASSYISHGQSYQSA